MENLSENLLCDRAVPLRSSILPTVDSQRMKIAQPFLDREGSNLPNRLPVYLYGLGARVEPPAAASGTGLFRHKLRQPFAGAILCPIPYAPKVGQQADKAATLCA